MSFTKYASIENSYRKKFLDKIVMEGHSAKEFVVQEKIHGANFSFWMSGGFLAPVEERGILKVAKRSGFIREDENFFNHEALIDKYEKAMMDLFNSFEAEGANEVVVFGEIYGGLYNHSDVEPTHHSSVQKEIQYRPDQGFIAFDLKLDGLFMSVDFTNEVFEKFGIPHAKTLFRGKLSDCLNYPNDFQTTIPAILGLPEIEGNICEGTVVRPIKPEYLWDKARLILKNKNEKFTEKEQKPKTPREPLPDLSPEAQKLAESLEQYINDNRLRNVLSHIGTVTNKDFGKIMKSFSSDIIGDFIKDSGEELNELSKEERKRVTKLVGRSASTLLRANFVNIIDGEF